MGASSAGTSAGAVRDARATATANSATTAERIGPIVAPVCLCSQGMARSPLRAAHASTHSPLGAAHHCLRPRRIRGAGSLWQTPLFLLQQHAEQPNGVQAVGRSQPIESQKLLLVEAHLHEKPPGPGSVTVVQPLYYAAIPAGTTRGARFRAPQVLRSASIAWAYSKYQAHASVMTSASVGRSSASTSVTCPSTSPRSTSYVCLW
jgi:hypothetical protein